MNLRRKKVPSINPAFAAFPLRIARSGILGYGVFAAGPIPRGRKVIEYTGEGLRVQESIARLMKLLRPGRPKKIYTVGLNLHWRIDGAVGAPGQNASTIVVIPIYSLAESAATFFSSVAARSVPEKSSPWTTGCTQKPSVSLAAAARAIAAASSIATDGFGAY